MWVPRKPMTGREVRSLSQALSQCPHTRVSLSPTAGHRGREEAPKLQDDENND